MQNAIISFKSNCAYIPYERCNSCPQRKPAQWSVLSPYDTPPERLKSRFIWSRSILSSFHANSREVRHAACILIDMKREMVALPVHQERISPLMDVAKRFAIYELEDGEIRQKLLIDIHADAEPYRVEKLKEIGVNCIICGAASGFVCNLIAERGIRLIPWAQGPVDEVIARYLNNEIIPCCAQFRGFGRRRRRRGCEGGAGGGIARRNNTPEEEQ